MQIHFNDAFLIDAISSRRPRCAESEIGPAAAPTTRSAASRLAPSAPLRTVTAGEPWTDTGLELRAGQDLYFSPEGMVIWSAGHEDGPGGEANSPYDTRRPIPGRPAGGLIGRIGTGADTFFIGTDRGPYRVRVPGRLFLGINDDYFEDNAGRFHVTISY